MIVYFLFFNKPNQQKKIRKPIQAGSVRSESLRYPYQADVSSVLTNRIAASVNEICVIYKYHRHVIVWS